MPELEASSLCNFLTNSSFLLQRNSSRSPNVTLSHVQVEINLSPFKHQPLTLINVYPVHLYFIHSSKTSLCIFCCLVAFLRTPLDSLECCRNFFRASPMVGHTDRQTTFPSSVGAKKMKMIKSIEDKFQIMILILQPPTDNLAPFVLRLLEAFKIDLQIKVG